LKATNAPAKTELLTGIGATKRLSVLFVVISIFSKLLSSSFLSWLAALSALPSCFAVCESGPCYDAPMNLAPCGARVRVNVYWVWVRCTAGGKTG
jgi:hypothetical protein